MSNAPGNMKCSSYSFKAFINLELRNNITESMGSKVGYSKGSINLEVGHWMASQSALSRMTIYFDAMKTLHQTRQIDNYILGARSPSKVLLDIYI